MPTTPYPSLTALDRLVEGLGVGPSRRRQLGMVRSELERALQRGALPVSARRSLRRLLEEETLTPFVRLAESGALRARLVRGTRPPTSESTNELRLQCLQMLRRGVGLPAWHLGGGALALRPTPEFGTLAALRRRLDQDLGRCMPPGQVRLTAVLALLLDAAPRAGELVGQRLAHLAADCSALHIQRAPQHGTTATPEEWVQLSSLSRVAVERWLSLRGELVSRAHGTTRLWVSLHPNHSGTLDDTGESSLRPAGVPLEENGLITSYRRGRSQYGLGEVLPPKIEQLRRAVLSETPPVVVDVRPE